MKIVKYYVSPQRTERRQWEISRKALGTDFTVSEGERAVVAMISTESIDRDGEIMRAAGADLRNYEKNPIVIGNHDYGDLPLAQCVSLAKLAGKGIRAKMIFAKRPDNHTGEWPPDICLSLIQQRTLRGFSVGFRPITGHYATDSERKKYGAALRYIHDEWELLEFSIVTLPANQDAVVEAVSKTVATRQVVYIVGQNPPTPKRVIVCAIR